MEKGVEVVGRGGARGGSDLDRPVGGGAEVGSWLRAQVGPWRAGPEKADAVADAEPRGDGAFEGLADMELVPGIELGA